MSTATSELEAVDLFNELIAKCQKSERVFADAAQAVNRPELKRLLETYAKQRRRFALELRVEVVRLGGILETPSSARRHGSEWAQEITRGDDEQAVLAKVASSEDDVVTSYEGSQGIELRAPLRAILDRQMTALFAGQNRIRELQRHHKKSA